MYKMGSTELKEIDIKNDTYYCYLNNVVNIIDLYF